jgi:hypothetical protein
LRKPRAAAAPAQRSTPALLALSRLGDEARNQDLSAVLAHKRPQPGQMIAAVPVNVINLLHQNQRYGRGLLPPG